jgi:nucleoside 2-deoxyribosyltransferase
MRLYIAGPMRGLKEFNFPAFDATAARLRAKGHEVVSPAEMDREAYGDMEKIIEIAKKPDATKEFMSRDLAAMLGCDGILMLPGWGRSEGACIEALVAAMCGMPVFDNERLEGTLSIYRVLVIVGEKITS